jgi:nicotinamidase-related amidase
MSVALIVIDMLNRYEHEDSEQLLGCVREIVPVLARLIATARQNEILTVYVNDNHSDWAAGRSQLSQWALEGADRSVIDPILPRDDAPFLVKARHSVFYETQLEYLLRQAGVDRVVLAGQVTEQCILYSALDTYVRHFDVVVARDAVTHIHEDLAEAALRMINRNMRAELVSSSDIASHIATDRFSTGPGLYGGRRERTGDINSRA